jgi:hypothetical protein
MSLLHTWVTEIWSGLFYSKPLVSWLMGERGVSWTVGRMTTSLLHGTQDTCWVRYYCGLWPLEPVQTTQGRWRPQGFYHILDKFLFYNRVTWKETCGKLQVYSSEFHEWLIYLKNNHGDFYRRLPKTCRLRNLRLLWQLLFQFLYQDGHVSYKPAFQFLYDTWTTGTEVSNTPIHMTVFDVLDTTVSMQQTPTRCCQNSFRC